MLPLARRPVPGRAVKVAGGIVSGFRLTVAKPRGDVPILGGKPGLAPANAAQLVRAGILPVLGRLGPVLGGDPSVVDGSLAVVRRTRTPGVGDRPVVRILPPFGHRAIAGGPIEVTGRIVTRLGLSVTQPGGDIAILRRKTRFPAPDPAQLVGAGILTVLGGVRAIFGSDLAVLDSLCSVVRGRGDGTFTGRVLARAGRAVSSGAVQSACRVVAGGRLAISLLGFAIAHVRGQVAVAALDIALTRGRKRVVGFIKAMVVLIYGRHRLGQTFIHVSRSWALPNADERFSVCPSP